MADINWPSGPVPGQTYTSPDGDTWTWNGYAWDSEGITPFVVGATNGLNLDADRISLGGILGENTLIEQRSASQFDIGATLTIKDQSFKFVEGFSGLRSSVVDILRTDFYYSSGKQTYNNSVIRIGGSENISEVGGVPVLYCAGATLSGYETHNELDDTSAITVLNGQQIVLNAYMPEIDYVSDLGLSAYGVDLSSTAILTDESGNSNGDPDSFSGVQLRNGNEFRIYNWQLGQVGGGGGANGFLIRDDVLIGEYNSSFNSSHISLKHIFSMKQDLVLDYVGIQTDFTLDPSGTIGRDFYAHKINTPSIGNWPEVAGTKYGIHIESSELLNYFGGDVAIGTDTPKGTGAVIPKLTVFGGDSGVGSGSLPIDTTLIIDNDSTSYIGILSPDASNSGIYLGSPSDPFGTSLTWNYDNLKSILASRVADGTWDIIVGNKNDASITIEGKVTSVGDRNADFTLYGDLYLPQPTVPGTAGSTGSTGQMSWDGDYIYVCTGTNTWKRTQINNW